MDIQGVITHQQGDTTIRGIAALRAQMSQMQYVLVRDFVPPPWVLSAVLHARFLLSPKQFYGPHAHSTPSATKSVDSRHDEILTFLLLLYAARLHDFAGENRSLLQNEMAHRLLACGAIGYLAHSSSRALC